MKDHLRKHMKDGLQQRIRMEKKIDSYKQQEVKSRERAVEENILQNQMLVTGASAERVEEVKVRKEKDIRNYTEAAAVIVDSKLNLNQLTKELFTHGQELSEIEITTGGFYEHSVGVYDTAQFIEKTNTISFNEAGGHVQMMTPIIRSSWKDASQLTIRKIVKEEA